MQYILQECWSSFNTKSSEESSTLQTMSTWMRIVLAINISNGEPLQILIQENTFSYENGCMSLTPVQAVRPSTVLLFYNTKKAGTL